ncbi:MAG: hypothetical protein J6Y77_07695 [Paludibacteraceae bacterium]|nr:hypothetical protein [Paludibacteraceae bacterium]
MKHRFVVLLCMLAPCVFAQEEPTTGIVDNHEWVDLGLSVKWATCNIGAQSPSDFGDFFAWGETMAKKKFTWKNYKYRLDGDDVRSVRFTQYNTVRGRGKVDNRMQLSPLDDAARINWSRQWRIPSPAEWQELWKNCSAELVTIDGHPCYKLTSKINGNSIVLPLGGIKGPQDSERTIGSYWSCMLMQGEASGAQNITLNEKGVRWNLNSARMYGRSIRPVLDEPKKEEETDGAAQ